MCEQQLFTHGKTVKEGIYENATSLLGCTQYAGGVGHGWCGPSGSTYRLIRGWRQPWDLFYLCEHKQLKIIRVCASKCGPRHSRTEIPRGHCPWRNGGVPSFSGEASTIHTALSLLWLEGAPARPKDVPSIEGDNLMPFKEAIDFRHPAQGGVATVTLTEPGLYVFICDIHVYMFAAVIVDNPDTPGLDLGKKIKLADDKDGNYTVPTYSDLAVRNRWHESVTVRFGLTVVM